MEKKKLDTQTKRTEKETIENTVTREEFFDLLYKSSQPIKPASLEKTGTSESHRSDDYSEKSTHSHRIEGT